MERAGSLPRAGQTSCGLRRFDVSGYMGYSLPDWQRHTLSPHLWRDRCFYQGRERLAKRIVIFALLLPLMLSAC